MRQPVSHVGALHFTDIALPSESRLGMEGRGFHTMMSVLDKDRVGIITAIAVDIAQADL